MMFRVSRNVSKLQSNIVGSMKRINKSHGAGEFSILRFASSTSFSTQPTDDERNAALSKKRKSRNAKIRAGAKTAKDFMRLYGPVFAGTYLSVYVGTLSGIFMALDLDIFSASTFGMDPQVAIEKLCTLVEDYAGYKGLPDYIRENPRAGTFALAWVMTKFTEPARFVASTAIVRPTARLLGRIPPEDDDSGDISDDTGSTESSSSTDAKSEKVA